MTRPAEAGSRNSTTLVRGLTLLPLGALLVTSVLGTGVFLKARVMTCNVGSPGLVLLAYAAGGVFTIAGALSIAELSAMMPRAGGQYNYIGAAFGARWAFLYGWMELLIDGAASNAAIAMVSVIFFNDLIGGTLSLTATRLLTVATLVAMTAITLASVRANGRFATLVTALKVLLVLAIGTAAFLFSDGTWSHFARSGAAGTCDGVSSAARTGLAGFGAAVVGALWSYTGWNVIGHLGGEVRDAARTYPRALIGGTVVLITLYLFLNAGYFYVLTPETVASVPETSSVARELLLRLAGANGAALIAAGLMVCSLGALHSIFLTISRIPYAMARDGLLPAALARVSPRTHAPSNAILLLGAVSIGFVLSGTFDFITDVIVFALLGFNGLSVAAIYLLRRRLPDLRRPYRTWGYPVVPALFLAATAYLMLNTLVATPMRALAGVGVVATGYPLYAWYARRRAPFSLEDFLGGEEPAQ